MKVLSKGQIILLHAELIRETGGKDGLLDEGLLEAAIAAPFQEFGGAELFPSLFQKAARLGFGLAANHPFADGNKRIGAHAMLVFLAINGVSLEYSQEDLAKLFLDVASGAAGYEDVLAWIVSHQ